jgi:hypothetical protein
MTLTTAPPPQRRPESTWSGDPGDYVRGYYGVPAFAGGRIRFAGKPGVIVDFAEGGLVAIVDGCDVGAIHLHPTWKVDYIPRVQVQSWRRPGGQRPDDVVNVARPTPWGNPFDVAILRANGFAADLESAHRLAVESFAAWLANNAPDVPTDHISPARRGWMLRNLPKLRGKRLACYCKPDQHCHADHLALLALYA